MGVNNLWKALVKGDAVKTFEGSKPGQHAEIVKEVENKVVAVDLSAWLMQAQTQPALLEHYDSAYARAVKVVFDRTIHWLRYGCLPVFVIEGQTPAAKLDKLRQRCIAQYGPTSLPYSVGNRAGGQFDKLGQAVKRLLDAFGIPCVQAVGEGEAMCAALNLCGWVHACHTLDVDVLLFGALTVYRQMHLQTDDPRRSVLTKCCRSDVQHVLGISRGGDAALMAVAQLAGGDYDTVGAEQVGEALALEAVRCLLRGHDDDEDVLQELDAAITAGPDPELDALKGCTGCKACGHEGGRKSRIAQHTARGGGCAACGCSSGCTPRQWQQCECEFHRRADERLLNRVVSRALKTPGFVNNCRTAAATYADQLQQAIAAVQREYGLPVSGSSANVFTWRHRPDVRAISEIMCRYIKEWDHNQVRLKLLPLLLEWDVRQGPSAGPAAGVQFRPTGIRKVSGKANEGVTGVPLREQHGWRYVLLVERLQQHKPSQLGAAAGSSGGAAGAAAAAPAGDMEAEDLAIDLAWIANKARSKPPKPAAAGGGDGAAGGSAGGGAEELAGDGELDDLQLGSQLCYPSQSQATQGFSCSQQPLSQASGSQAASGGRSSGSLQFSEHRSLRCSLMEAVWPELVAAFRNPPAASGRARSGGRKKAAAGAAAAAAAADGTDKQRSVKDFFGTVKDYTAAKPASKPGARQPAGNGDIIPGLAGIASSSRQAAAAAAHAATADARDMQLSSGFSPAAAVVAAAAAAEATGGPDVGHSSTKRPPQGSFMDWIESLQQDEQEQAPQQPQLHDAWGYCAAPEAANSSREAAAAAPAADNGAHRVFVGAKSSQGVSSPAKRTASAGARTPGRSAGGRARGRGSSKQHVMPAGAMDRFLQPAAAPPPPPAQLAAAQPASTDSTQPPPSQQHKQQSLPEIIDCCDSPEVLPLAARLANRAAAAGPTGRSIPAAAELLPAQAGAAGAAASTAAQGSMAPPAKRASTDRAREALSSPEKTGAASSAAAAAADAAGCSSPQEKDQQQSWQQPAVAAAAAGVQPRAITQQYQALVDAIAGPSPVASSQVHPHAPGSSTARELFNAEHRTVRQHQQQQHQHQQHQHQQHQQLATPDVIELLDSPASTAGSKRNVEVVDLT